MKMHLRREEAPNKLGSEHEPFRTYGQLTNLFHDNARDRHELSWSECTPKGLDEHSLERPSTDSSYRLDIPLEFEPKGLGS